MTINTFTKIFNIGFVFLMSLLLNGCSVFAPVKVEPTTSYVINAKPAPLILGKRTSSVLLVSTPQALSAYDSNHMAYTTQVYQIAYFTKNNWADTPTQMLQPLIVNTLQNTRHYHAVVAAPFAGQYDFILNTQLLELQQSFLQHPSQIHITLRAQLVKYATSQVVATRDFTITRTAFQDTPYGGVVAINEATRELLRQLAQFCIKNS